MRQLQNKFDRFAYGVLTIGAFLMIFGVAKFVKNYGVRFTTTLMIIYSVCMGAALAFTGAKYGGAQSVIMFFIAMLSTYMIIAGYGIAQTFEEDDDHGDERES